jgi:hypothetical protein
VFPALHVRVDTFDHVDPRPCTVVEPPDRWPGSVLAWQRSESAGADWSSFRKVSPEGWSMTYYHWLSSDVLEPR